MSWIEYTSYKNYPSKEVKQIPWQCQLNDIIIKKDGLNTSWGYRDYLQKNSNMIIDHNSKNALLGHNTNIINRGYTTYPSDLKQSFLQKEKANKICCPSILM